MSGIPLIKEIIDTQIIMIPCAMDAFGCLGPVARKLLYVKDKDLMEYHNGHTVSDIKVTCQEANTSKHAPSTILDRSARNLQQYHLGAYTL